MTKEEIKELLQHTKIYVAGKSKEIQKKLFELGITWVDGSEEVDFTWSPFLYIDDGLISYDSDMEDFRRSLAKEITADYILNLSWNKEKLQYQFKPFEKVLVRDFDNEYWCAAFYSHQDKYERFVINGGSHYDQCIPYEGNENLIGTSNKPKEK